MLLFFFVFHQSYAQDRIEISGKVTTSGEDTAPLPFINVLVNGITRGATTDFDGNFNITVASDRFLARHFIWDRYRFPKK